MKAPDTRGVYDKFRVTRTDGQSAPGGEHETCTYFVLDLDHDPFARPALAAYALACRERRPALAGDLEEALATRPCGCRSVGDCPHLFSAQTMAEAVARKIGATQRAGVDDAADVARLTGELARCENDLQVALAREATAREEAARLRVELAGVREALRATSCPALVPGDPSTCSLDNCDSCPVDLRAQLAERDAALAVAGEALGPFARCYHANFPGGMDDGDVLSLTPEWMERTPIKYGDLEPAAFALSAPALARAVALDWARREVCAAVEVWRGAPFEASTSALASASVKLLEADDRLRALEAEPATAEPPP